MRTTLLDAKRSRIPKAIGVCPDEDKLVEILNEAQQRLLTKGSWYGTYGRFRICAYGGCITLPAQLASIEAVAVSGVPIRLHDQFFEFLENGYGIRGSGGGSCDSGSCGTSAGCGIPEALMRGRFPTFRDIIPSGKKAKVVCDLVDDVGKEVLILGYDDNGNWIRTDQGGTILDGEVVVMAQGAGTISTNFFSSITDIQPPDDLDGQWWLYEYNNAAATSRMLSRYDYWETRPSYARYYFPSVGCCDSSEDDSCATTTVDILGKLEFIPVARDTDYLTISNIPALKAMCVAINNAEKQADAVEKNRIMAAGYKEALAELDTELNHYRGDVQPSINLMGSSLYGNDMVPNLL